MVAVDAAGEAERAFRLRRFPAAGHRQQPVTARQARARNIAIRVAAIRSLGDLRTRVVNGKETMNFWDVERPRFQHPAGTAHGSRSTRRPVCFRARPIDREAEVVVTVELERDLRRLDEEALKWGIEKVVSSGTETAGSATQGFVIEVSP